MTGTPILLPEAKADVAAAYVWYEEQSPGLGREFLRCVETALLATQRNPLSSGISLSLHISAPASAPCLMEKQPSSPSSV
jgi:hypothetical protein